MFEDSKFKKSLLASLLIVLLFTSVAFDANAQQKRRKKDNGAAAAQAKAESELQEKLKKVDEELSILLRKSPSRSLLSPNDAGKLADLKYTLQDLVDQNPSNPSLAKPLYRLGILFADRQEFSDSYGLFKSVIELFPTTSYAQKSYTQLEQLRMTYGEQLIPALPKPETPDAKKAVPPDGKEDANGG